jgi:hypothetical protein
MTITTDEPRRAGSRGGAQQGSARARSAAAQRAMDRRAKRQSAQRARVAEGRMPRETPGQRALRRHREGGTVGGRLVTRLPHAPGALARKVPFLLGVIVLVCAGMAFTLWLSTGSAEKSYELSRQDAVNKALAERKAGLERDVQAGDSAPGLADRAGALGMVPAGNPPMLVVGPSGRVTVVGKVAAATGTPLPPLNQQTVVPGAPNGAPGPSGGEQLVTMNSGSPTVANTRQGGAPAPTTAAPTTSAPTAQAQAPANSGQPQASPTAIPTTVVLGEGGR